MTRTWTATIEAYDPRTRRTTARQAQPSTADLLREQAQSAVREAVPLVDAGYEVAVHMSKRTQARGVEVDRTYTVVRDKHGRIRYL